MARLGINTGTAANDGTGDTLLVAGGKVNSNFSEIYNIIGDGTNTFVGVVTQITAGNNLVTVGGPGGISTSYGSVVVSGVGQTGYINAADLIVTGISTLGVVTGATYYGDGSNLTGLGQTQNVRTESLNVVGVATVGGHLSLATFNATGICTFGSTSAIELADAVKLNFGDNNDVNLHHPAGTADLVVEGTGETLAKFTDNAGVELYYNNNKRFETTNTGTFATGISTAEILSATTELRVAGIATITKDLSVSGITTVGIVTGHTPGSASFHGGFSGMHYGNGANLIGLNASSIQFGTLPDARFPATLPALNGSALTSLNATNLGSGTVPDARFPATLPASDGSALTTLNASELDSGTIPDARFPATLPALNGSALTNLNGSNIASGTVSAARVGALPASKITTGTFDAARIPSLDASKVTTGTFDAARIPTLNQNTTGTAALAEGLTGTPSIVVNTITANSFTFNNNLTVNALGVGTATAPTSGVDIRSGSTVPLQVITTTGSGNGASLRLRKHRSGQATQSGDKLGGIIMQGDDGTEDTYLATYGGIRAECVTATQGSEDGKVEITTIGSGSEVIGATLYSDGSVAGRFAHDYTLTAPSSSAYVFNGQGIPSSIYPSGASNPDLPLIRGYTYRFINNTGGHPFRIQSTKGGSTGTQYNHGVTNNDGGNGTVITFTVPYNAPPVLYYQCTSHGLMNGEFRIVGPGPSSGLIADGNWTVKDSAGTAYTQSSKSARYVLTGNKVEIFGTVDIGSSINNTNPVVLDFSDWVTNAAPWAAIGSGSNDRTLGKGSVYGQLNGANAELSTSELSNLTTAFDANYGSLTFIIQYDEWSGNNYRRGMATLKTQSLDSGSSIIFSLVYWTDSNTW